MTSSLSDKYEIILNTLPQFVFILTETGTYVEAFGHDTFTNTPGFDIKRLIGWSINELFDQQRAANFSALIHKAIATESEQIIEYSFSRSETLPIVDFPAVEADVWYEGVIRPLNIEHHGERTILWSVKNITQKVNLEQDLRDLSETDELTGVTNRRSLMSMMQCSFDKAQRSNQIDCLILLDVDHFKLVNDSLGHQMGDQVLRHISDVCSTHLRDHDIFARFGGEEFAILLPNTDEELGFYIAERLRLAIETNPCGAREQGINVTASFGLSSFKHSDSSLNMVLGRADKALYHSKNTGRNRTTVFTSTFDE